MLLSIPSDLDQQQHFYPRFLDSVVKKEKSGYTVNGVSPNCMPNSCQEKKAAAAKNVTCVGSLNRVSLHYLLLLVGLEEIFH